MDMQTIVDDWKANAERYFKETFRFLRSLKMKDDRAVDRVAHRLHEEAFSYHRLHSMCQLPQNGLSAVPQDGHSPDCPALEHEANRVSSDVLAGWRRRRSVLEEFALPVPGNRQPLHDLRGASSGLCRVIEVHRQPIE